MNEHLPRRCPRCLRPLVDQGSLEKQGGNLSAAPLLITRAGRHDRWDRLVFEFHGPADGYRVGYASEVYPEAKGDPLSGGTAGVLTASTCATRATTSGATPPNRAPTVPMWPTWRATERCRTSCSGERPRAETAIAVLASQLNRQLGMPPGCVSVSGLAGKVPSAAGT